MKKFASITDSVYLLLILVGFLTTQPDDIIIHQTIYLIQ